MFGVGPSAGRPGALIVCVDHLNNIACDMMPDTSADLVDPFLLPGTISGRELTLRLHLADGSATAEIPELGYTDSLAVPTMVDVTDQDTGETEQRPRLISLVLFSFSSTIGHVRWDHLLTNQVPFPNATYSASVTPLSLDGTAYDEVIFPVPNLAAGYRVIGDPYDPLAPKELLDLFHDAVAKLAGLKPGPAHGNILASLAPHDPRLDSLPFFFL